MTNIGRLGLMAALGILLLAGAGIAVAETEAEKAKAEAEAREMAEMQRALNAEVMAKPFSVTEMAEIDSYIASALKKNLVPEAYKGAQPWGAGMTCAHLRGYYSRRDCQYYHRYHGRYYPY